MMKRAILFLVAIGIAFGVAVYNAKAAEPFTRIEWITRQALDEYLFEAYVWPPITTRLSKLNARSPRPIAATFRSADRIEYLGTFRASWYGGGERLNKHTASGEHFDPAALTCATGKRLGRVIPFGTMLRVTRIDRSWLTVDCRVNDRGPRWSTGRAIDLARGAAKRIELIRIGEAEVKIEVIR